MNENGPKWARAGLVAGVLASVAGNVANACLTETTVNIVLRIPMAVIWPVFLFIAVEVLVRNRGVHGFLARVGQGALLTVTVPTAITSYVNLHALMIKAGEPGIAQITGPLAIDGVMLGCTVMLLASRTVDIVRPEVAKYVAVSLPDSGPAVNLDNTQDLSQVPDTLTQADTDWLANLENRLGPMDSTPAVPVVPGKLPQRTRVAKAKDGRAEIESLILAAQDADVLTPGQVDELLAGHYEVSTRTIRRIRAALNGQPTSGAPAGAEDLG